MEIDAAVQYVRRRRTCRTEPSCTAHRGTVIDSKFSVSMRFGMLEGASTPNPIKLENSFGRFGIGSNAAAAILPFSFLRILKRY
jgi:hypothetical protein